MTSRGLLYYITDRKAFSGSEAARRRQLLEKIAEAARAGVEYIQLREKDLSTRELKSLAMEAVRAIREADTLASDSTPLTPALLINSRTDVALAVEADGVHLRSDDVSAREVTEIWKKAGCLRGFRRDGKEYDSTPPLIGVSCHSPAEVIRAAGNGASFAVFGPVFEKGTSEPTGLAQLQEACKTRIPVLALGGVTLENARSCLDAGASGIAGIRLFQENDIETVVKRLRERLAT